MRNGELRFVVRETKIRQTRVLSSFPDSVTGPKFMSYVFDHCRLKIEGTDMAWAALPTDMESHARDSDFLLNENMSLAAMLFVLQDSDTWPKEAFSAWGPGNTGNI